MSSNVGLSTPRGSGTSGYVQRNWAFMKPRETGRAAPYPTGPETRPFKQRQPDAQILAHDRLRAVEVKVMEERERLEEENEKGGAVLGEEEIDERCEGLRRRLLREMEEGKGKGEGEKGRRRLKSYRVHELAEAKIEESERLRRALGIREDREGLDLREREERRESGKGKGRDRERERD